MGDRVSIAAALLAGLFIAGCGSQPPPPSGEQRPAGGDSSSTRSKPKPVATVDVRETDFELNPSTLRLERPGVVRFRVRNDGQAPHALEVEGPKGEVETEEIVPGRSATLTADLSKPGSYTWYCPVGDHKERGMEGKITVR